MYFCPMCINYLDKAAAIKKMNQWGGEGRAFFFMVDFKAQNSIILEPKEAFKKGILFQIGESWNFEQTEQASGRPAQIKSFPPSFEEYEKSFRLVKNELNFGNSYLTNLTCRTGIETNLSPAEIFMRSKAMYRIFLPDHFVVFSPERFVHIDAQGQIHSHPMKGTIDAALPDAENKILNDRKEMAEHNTIVDLIRNDLSRIAEHVRVKKFRYINHLQTSHKNLLQVSSQISGQLPTNWKSKLGTLLFDLLPAGSISGAPKEKTVEIIEAAEKHPRGFYTGITGYFDGTSFDSGVMIRFIEMEGGKLYYRSGGGITVNSEAAYEYEEMKDKIYVPVY